MPAAREVIPSFEDRLRALGALLDGRGLHTIALAIDRDAIAVSAQQGANDLQTTTRITLDAREVGLLCHAARARRGRGGTRRPEQRPSRLAALGQAGGGAPPLSAWAAGAHDLPYQELLRLIGADLDNWGAIACRLDEGDEGVTLCVRAPEASQADPAGAAHTYFLSRQEVRRRIARATRQRGQGQAYGARPAGGLGRTGRLSRREEGAIVAATAALLEVGHDLSIETREGVVKLGPHQAASGFRGYAITGEDGGLWCCTSAARTAQEFLRYVHPLTLKLAIRRVAMLAENQTRPA